MSLHQRKIAALAQNLLDWFASSARDLPWRRTHDPYAIWVSEIMLQQTQVKTVIPFWERWMKALPSIEALAKIDPGKLHKLWEGLGYYTRVRNMQKAARLILDRHQGRFPDQHDSVLELPGIGPYTAGAICSIAFNQPQPILDGNVMRVLSRAFAIEGDPKDKKVNAQLWALARELVKNASGKCSELNQSLMELGALVCTPRQPACKDCPLAKHCAALKEDRVEQLPELKKPLRATLRRFAAFVVVREGRYLVRQRPEGGVNAHLWEFPNAEMTDSSTPESIVCAILGYEPRFLRPMTTIKHSITRYRITLEVFFAEGGNEAPPLPAGSQWLSLTELKRRPFASAHKKILSNAGLWPAVSQASSLPR